MPSVPRRVAVRAASLLLFASLVLAGPALSPRAGAQACMRWTPLWPPLGFHLNCDSPRFMKLAAEPAGLFTYPGLVWQSRPVYVLLGAAVALPLRGLLPALDWPLPPGQAASWWAYVLLNFTILLVAVCLFDSLVGARSGLTIAAFVFGSWLLANGVVKRFVWTPHTQLFNVLVPIVALQAARRGLRRPGMTTAGAAALGLVCGIGALAYGSFAIACAAFVVSSWLGRRQAEHRDDSSALAVQGLCVLAAFAVPLVAWWSYVRLRTGSFYSHEIEAYRQFVWIGDALRQGPAALAAAVVDNLRFFLRTVGSVLWLPGAVLAALVGLAWARGVPLRRLARAERPLLVASAVVFGLTFVFLALLGFYAERLSWALVPPLLVACVKVGEALDASAGRAGRTALRATLVLTLALGVALLVRAPLAPFAPGTPAQAQARARAQRGAREPAEGSARSPAPSAAAR